MRSAILEHTLFEDCLFQRANLSGVKLAQSEFYRTRFEETSLHKSDLTWTKFSRCDFEDSSINSSCLNQSVFSISFFNRTRILKVYGLSTANFSGTLIHDCLLTDLVLYRILDKGADKNSTKISNHSQVPVDEGRQSKGKNGLIIPVYKSDVLYVRKQSHSNLSLDQEKIQSKIKESLEVEQILGEIFLEEKIREERTSILLEERGAKLNEGQLSFLYFLARKEIWDRNELRTVAQAKGLMLDSTLESINDAAVDICDETLTYGEDPIEIDVDVLEQLL
ncbi:tellurite resistance TerB C-terminal domain-containing protein [Nodosilinea sp. PGN35]|uniref:tellurite resistance TerB C-terminal domain-containing protein n=1 Tax=Nodosilinea sp. PGN35 TaxID=3020489 RepID=UPI00398BA174